MANPWITHVKQYAKTHNISYREALKRAKSTYKKKGGKVKGGKVKKRGKK